MIEMVATNLDMTTSAYKKWNLDNVLIYKGAWRDTYPFLVVHNQGFASIGSYKDGAVRM